MFGMTPKRLHVCVRLNPPRLITLPLKFEAAACPECLMPKHDG